MTENAVVFLFFNKTIILYLFTFIYLFIYLYNIQKGVQF